MKSKLFLAIAFAAVVPQLALALGNDNPTGVAGVFNGNITTGGSYDPYTGNARRTVNDIDVAGAVGSYPLSWQRHLNTRNDSSNVFGLAGHWSHSYEWYFGASTGHVSYPDGRTADFALPCNNICEPDPGLSDRLRRNDDGSYDLLLADGGKVQFPPGWSKAAWIIDPFGNGTHLEYDGNGMLWRVTEPAGRYLEISYTTNPWEWHQPIISSVAAWDGRGNVTQSVTYSYAQASYGGWTCLTQATYSDGTHSTYTYRADNQLVADRYEPSGPPLILTADDVRYPGAMTKIRYTYARSNMGSGVIDEEQSIYGDRVSKLTYPFSLPDNENGSRTETRGDGPQRQFSYTDARLFDYTDFQGHWSHIMYEGYVGFPIYADDANGHRTAYGRGVIGALTEVVYAQYTGDEAHDYFGYTDGNNPYYLAWKRDARGNTTSYERWDGYNRINRVWYSNGAYEEFYYNGFGQVTTHRQTNGYWEYFDYDGRGMKWRWRDANGNSTTYTYDVNDHLSTTTDPNNHTWTYYHNQRGQRTIDQNPDGTMKGYIYDDYGNKTLSRDELSHDTTWTYDNYRRVLTVTNALNQTTSYDYRQDWSNSNVQTSSQPKGVFLPSGRATHYAYDENWHKTIERQAPATADDAWTYFGYDAVGSQAWVQDPRGNRTNYGYDARNRRTTTTNALNQTTWCGYDAASNKTWETRADGTSQSWGYDAMNRLLDHYGFAGEHTHYYLNLSGTLSQVTDAKGAVYSFGYDNMNRKASEGYPADAGGAYRYEQFWYDGVGNLTQYKNPADQYKHIHYDLRNRADDAWWNSTNSVVNPGTPNWGMGQEVTTIYDAASRITSVTTNNGETTVGFGYDGANRQIWEDQTLAGYPTRHETSDRDGDGNRSTLWVYTNGGANYGTFYDYNQRNQLAHIYDGNWTPMFSYSYDAAGNMTQRVAVYGGVNDSVNAWSQYYDSLNRPTMWENTGSGGSAYARSWYQYDSVGREAATWRDEQSSKGEKFWYTANDQLSVAEYNADQVWTGNPANWDRSVGYSYTPDLLNRSSVNDNGNTTTYSASSMNQYTNLSSSGAIGYDANFNIVSLRGISITFDANNHLVTDITNGTTGQFTYDGLGRCVKGTVNGATSIFTFDGWKPIVEWDGNGNFVAWNIYGAGQD